MKIIVFSDTHGFPDECNKVMEKYNDIDAIIHAGDIERDEEYLKEKYADIPLYAVTGNNDFCPKLPEKLEFSLGGKKFFLTHGHRYSVRQGNYMLRELITQNGYDVVVYGHTHIPEHDYFGGGQILNPGSLFFSQTYGIIEIDGNNIDISIKKINE